MQLLDEPTQALADMDAGILWAYPQLAQVPQTHGFYLKERDSQTVPLIAGGGSGHEPAHWGYIGEGMLAAAVMGSMFTPPDAAAIVATTRRVAVHHQAFFIVKNFPADVASFSAARRQLEAAGYRIGVCVVADDNSVVTGGFAKRKRGVAGTVLVHKLLGAAAAAGAGIDELATLADAVLPNLRTIGFSLSGAQIPGQAAASFALPANTVAYGVGIHGEPGYREEPFESAAKLANELVVKLRQSFQWQAGEHYAVLVNSLGGTTVMENMIFNRDVRELLALEPLVVDFDKVGTFLASNGMQGLSLTLLRLATPDWLKALKRPTGAVAW